MATKKASMTAEETLKVVLDSIVETIKEEYSVSEWLARRLLAATIDDKELTLFSYIKDVLYRDRKIYTAASLANKRMEKTKKSGV